MSANEPRATRGITRIVVSELRLQARVGVNPGEQGAEQPVLVDVWLEIEDPERPEQSEQLADTVDYVTVARTVRGGPGRAGPGPGYPGGAQAAEVGLHAARVGGRR